MRHSIIQRSSTLCTRNNLVSEMAAGYLFRLLLVTSLMISLLTLCLNAVPVSRTGNLMHGSQADQLPEKTRLVTGEKSWEGKAFIGRMGVELNDYPGSGANNRHTPRAQPGSLCVDC